MVYISWKILSNFVLIKSKCWELHIELNNVQRAITLAALWTLCLFFYLWNITIYRLCPYDTLFIITGSIVLTIDFVCIDSIEWSLFDVHIDYLRPVDFYVE